ncbi:hypothetical protein K503DRAFT_190412 [Rhizopogon vinicolor AM-OR11-026]|uniref:Uncharacterized protein n=1 Tax=Rhizopogon vinicolor AM-OR11-026 TaxID=1314800 RepID=A0A1B7MDJ2_9AGAM|nr:hypothetical protein K503DRAFT_190412 [Rhizopogon vinicolor AM-OR11-026]
MDFTVYDMDDIKDVSDVNDIEDDSTTNTLDSRLLTFTREIFKGQISEAEYEEATVDFPLVSIEFKCSFCFEHCLNPTQIGETDADAADGGSEDSKAILNVRH